MKDILDIEGIYRFPWRQVILVSGIVLLALALLLLGVLFFKWIKKKREAGLEERLSPHEKAYLEIERLEKQHLLEKGEFRKYYFFLSEIFRRYLEERYEYPALEKTTFEMLPDLSVKVGLSPSLCGLADHFLRQADLVKFAQFQPTLESSRDDKQKIIEFVKSTIPVSNAA